MPLIACLHSPLPAQLSFSVEAGYVQNTILMDGDYGALSYYRDHVSGLRLGFNIHNRHNTTINFQLTYTDFIYHSHPNSFGDFFRNAVRPYFLIGPGMHFIHWGDLYDPVLAEREGAIDAYAPEWNISSQFYFNIGAGIELKIFKNLGLVVEDSWSYSKSFYFSPLVLALKYNL
jgi:hypothetical protein